MQRVRKPIVLLVALVTVSTFGAALLGPASRDSPAANAWAIQFPELQDASGSSDACEKVPAPQILSPDATYGGGTQCAVVAIHVPGASTNSGEDGGSAQAATFTNLVIPGATNAGEPTMGVTPSGAIFFQEGLRNWKSTNGGNTWAVNSILPTQVVSLDPLMAVDRFTGRVFVVHLYVGCSQLWYSDADGASLSWRYTPAACGTPGNDHQKLAAGPFRAPLTGGTPAYSDAVYYCYNGLVYGGCAMSPDGGLTWNPATIVGCGGTLGMPWVGDDGTVIVPTDNCGTNGITYSLNNGLTWASRGTQGFPVGAQLEPDVATTPDGTIYLSGTVAQAGNKHIPHAFTSTNLGGAWTARSLVGTTGVQSAAFPVVTTGANGKAAVAFLGTTCAGAPSNVAATCTWQLYVSITTDAGLTWETVQASPAGDPVQRGSICLSGINCGADRNLLDFMDIGHDNAGAVLVAYADGCVSATCIGAGGTNLHSRAAQGTVTKQTGGPFLI